jgi:hypothetical protein
VKKVMIPVDFRDISVWRFAETGESTREHATFRGEQNP